MSSPLTKKKSSRLPPWVVYHSAAYMGGKGLLYGTGPIYNREARTKQNFAFPVENGDFSLFANDRFDFVLLGSVGADITESVVSEAAGHLRVGGNLILALSFSDPSSALPQINEVVSKCGYWLKKDQFVKDGIVYAIFKRLRGRLGLKQNPAAKLPRACVSRLGAIGDMIMVTPLLRCLKEDGYHVTVNGSTASIPVLFNNPNVDNEGTLLKVEGRRDFYTTKEWRHKMCNVNYYDASLAAGSYGHVRGRNGEIYLTAKERRFAKRMLPDDTFNIVVSLTGTSHHKYNPLLGPVLGRYLNEHPETRVFMVGDERASRVTFVHSQAVDLTGKTTLREVFALVERADLVIGPETALTNAAACFDTPEIVFLSHSTRENLTKYWKNCIALEPEGCPCYPCHQLHYSEDSCPLANVQDEKGEVLATGPLCAMGSVSAERIVKAIDDLRGDCAIMKRHGTTMDAERGRLYVGS